MTPSWNTATTLARDDPPARGRAPPDRARERQAEQAASRSFVALCAVFRATGGIARGDELARWLEDRQRGDFVSLARLIVSGHVFSFAWHDTYWVPMFQFDPQDLSLRPATRQVLAELASDLDGWSIAGWFAAPNPWLSQRRPVDLLDIDLPAVLQAARADRFVATG